MSKNSVITFIFRLSIRIEFEILAAVIKKSSVFLEITPFSPSKVNRLSGETLPPFFSVWWIRQARKQREVRKEAESCSALIGLHEIVLSLQFSSFLPFSFVT
jgi:hypothetical protein